MKIIKSRKFLKETEKILITCSHQCNIHLLDDANFEKYSQGMQYDGRGSFNTRFPAELYAPNTGDWNIVFDLDGAKLDLYSFKYQIQVVDSEDESR